MESSKRPCTLTFALPVSGLTLGVGAFLASYWLDVYAQRTYCHGRLGCYDEHYVAMIPRWTETISTALTFTGLGLALLLSVAGIVVRERELSKGEQSGERRGLAIVGAMLSWLLCISVGLICLLIPLLEGLNRGIHGRPLRLAGRAITGRVKPQRSAWSEGITPNLVGIDATVRAQLAEVWLADARMEHAAIAAFSRLSCDLLAVGAPPRLIEAASRAAADEVRHAHVCFALASAYAGTPFGPQDLPEARSASLPRSRRRLLSDLLRISVIDGCLGERAAAHSAREGARQAVDPVVRRALGTIADEEMKHAVLADAIVDWARAELGKGADDIVDRAVRDAAGDVVETVVNAELACHGRPSGAALAAARAQAFEVVRAREATRAAA